MKYISIDIETTGLDSERYDVLSIGAIIEDTNNKLPYEELPKFHAAIKRQEITGSPFAINMNRDLIESIVRYQSAETQDEKNDLVNLTGMWFLNEDEVVEQFYYFLYVNGMTQGQLVGANQGQTTIDWCGKKIPAINRGTNPSYITVAGKNFGTFDKLFLEKLPRWKQLIRTRSRLIDPSVLFVDWKNDNDLPSLNTCKERAGVSGAVSHNALEDAWDVIQVMRKFY
jgi:DNA polymerase III epsilon subunit-like protein